MVIEKNQAEVDKSSPTQRTEVHTSLSSIGSFASPAATTPQALVAADDLRTSVQSSEWLRQGSASILGSEFKGLQTCGEPIQWHLPVPVYRTTAGAHYLGGLKTCGGVSVCPVCSWRVMRKRQRHLMACHYAATALGGSALIHHFTAGYPDAMRVADQRERLQAAYTRFSGSKNSLSGLRGRQAGVLGSFRSLEFKYNIETERWNPHYHGAIFFTGAIPPDFGMWLTERWQRSLGAVGLYGGEDTRPEAAVEKQLDYICKPIWTDETEDTGDRLTPFQLLARALDTGETRSVEAFKEYAFAMKGKRTTSFSRGLAEKLGLSEVQHQATDGELAKPFVSRPPVEELSPSKYWELRQQSKVNRFLSEYRRHRDSHDQASG